MASQVSQETALALERWLSRVGFSEGNPFGASQAERERFVPECFVDPGIYSAAKSDPRTTLVFAPRGGGKSALRVMLASECRPHQPPKSNPRSQDLAVTYTDFDPVLQACNHDLKQLTVCHHVAEILSVACTALLDTLWQDPALCAALSPRNRSLLASYCRQFNPSLIGADATYHRLSKTCPEIELPWTAFRQAVREQRLETILKETSISLSPSVQLHAELIDDTPDPLADLDSPVSLFSKFAQLVQDVGLATTYILVDRLDERLLTFHDPQNLASLIAPLVTHLSLMEISGIKFVWFLPREAQETILPLVRSRSLKSQDVVWENELLLDLLRLRLQVYSKDRVQSLGKLCEDTLAHRIETEMIEMSDGSPRRLLRLGASLFEAHVTISPSEHAITEAAWAQTPAKVLGEQYVRPLRIDRQAAQVYLGQTTPVQLPATPYNLLAYLYEAKGIRSNREISKAVWGDEEWASDEMIRTTVRRVKTALEKAGANADLYIVNEPGRGYKLQNTA